MPDINVHGMAEIEANHAKKEQELKQILSTPFDLNKNEHICTLKKYNDTFELSVNQMYLLRAISKGVPTGVSSWMIGYMLPIPEFGKYLLINFFYLGLAGYILKNSRENEFYEQLKSMKKIYGWAMKTSGENQDEICVDSKLANTEITRLIKLIAPLCSSEFIMTWPKETTQSESSPSWSKTFATGYTAISSTFSLFSRSYKKPNVNEHRIRELKISVETRGLDVGIFAGFEQAIRYFATNSQFKDMLSTELKQSGSMISNIIPSALTSSVYSKNN